MVGASNQRGLVSRVRRLEGQGGSRDKGLGDPCEKDGHRQQGSGQKENSDFLVHFEGEIAFTLANVFNTSQSLTLAGLAGLAVLGRARVHFLLDTPPGG